MRAVGGLNYPAALSVTAPYLPELNMVASKQAPGLPFPLIQLIPFLLQPDPKSLQKVQKPLPFLRLMDVPGAIHGFAAGIANVQQFSKAAIVLPVLQAGFADFRIVGHVDNTVHIEEYCL